MDSSKLLLWALTNLAICPAGSLTKEAIFWAGDEINPTIFPLSSSIDGRVAKKFIFSKSIFSPSYPPPTILNFSSFFSKLTATLAGATGSSEYAIAVGPVNKSA